MQPLAHFDCVYVSFLPINHNREQPQKHQNGRLTMKKIQIKNYNTRT